jgi:methionyl-tRNA formyltransferase
MQGLGGFKPLRTQGKAVAHLVLLTTPECAETVAGPLRAAGSAVTVAITRDDLRQAVAARPDRLVAFGTGVIVPEAMLGALRGGAYNFHPGPPALPGLFPSVHALYERHPDFGVTLHAMTAEIDGGAIVAVERFAIPADCDRLALDSATFAVMAAMAARFAPALADATTPLHESGERWTGRRRSRADFAALCLLPAAADTAEFARRLRAVGEGPDHALTIERFGRRFGLISDNAGDVVRGGVPRAG